MYNNTVANQRLWYAESGTVRVVEKKSCIVFYRTVRKSRSRIPTMHWKTG